MEIHELKDFLNEKLDLNSKLVAEKFDLNNQVVAEKFANISLQLDTIVKQTTKTNGRVNVLEDKMEGSEKFNSFHILKCPVKKELSDFKLKLEGDLFFFTFLRRYPKLSFMGAVILVAIIMAGGVEQGATIMKQIIKLVLGG